MWSSWVKIKDTTQVMHIAKLKDGSKRATKFSQTILERVLKMVWWRRRKWTHVKRFWSWNVFLLSKYWFPLFIYRDSWSFSFSFLFFQYFLFLSFFSRLRLFEDFGILMINEEKNTLQKFLFRWNVMEWLSHDYGNGGVVDISVVDAYFRMELCTPILLDEPSKKFGWQIIFEKFQNSQWSHPLTKLNINKSCYVDSIWIW
jgi:hypothetical protein